MSTKLSATVEAIRSRHIDSELHEAVNELREQLTPLEKHLLQLFALYEMKEQAPAGSGELPDHELAPVEYVEAGWALCPIPRGAKGPDSPGWNRLENTAHDLDAAFALMERSTNIGLCHAYSGTCAIDVDHWDHAKSWLAERGIDLDELYNAPDAVRIVGRAGRGKLLYRAPLLIRDGGSRSGEPMSLPTIKVAPYTGDDGKTYHALELRCGTRNGRTVQDVLPPSIHPDTGQPYSWELGSKARWDLPPRIPEELLEPWLSIARPTAERIESKAPTGAAADEMRAMLAHHDPDLDYDSWVRVGMALHHETDGSEDGLALWDEWSSRGSKYVGTADLESHWRSFGNHPDPVTLASLLPARVASPDDFDAVDAEELKDTLVEKPKLNIALTPLVNFVRRVPVRYLVEGLIEEGELFGFIGRRKSGKSYGALDLAFAVAQGRSWAGRKVLAPGPVVWIAAEGARSLRDRRGAQWEAHYGSADIRVWGRGLNLMKPDVRDALIEVCQGARLIVIDSLRRVTPGARESASDEFTLALENAEALALATDAAVCLVAHAGKDGSKGARGTSAIEDQIEAAFVFEKLEGVDTPTFKVSVPFARDEASGDAEWHFGLQQVAPDGMAPGVIVDWDVQAPARSRVTKLSESQSTLLGAVEGWPNKDWTVSDLRAAGREAGLAKTTARDAAEALIKSGLLVPAGDDRWTLAPEERL